MPSRELSAKGKIDRLKHLMEAMRTEVHIVSQEGWVKAFAQILQKKVLGSLLYSPRTEIGVALEKYWNRRKECGETLPELVPYDEKIETVKDRLFSVDAAIMSTKGAIIDTGAILLWPDENEPRTMSLVPPIHFAVLDAETIGNNLSEIMEDQCWSKHMPANALLISGPSKTADIELTLAFGVHGPKELVVLIRTREPNETGRCEIKR
jgi:L-lactate dehydrogenase complex protein LldG